MITLKQLQNAGEVAFRAAGELVTEVLYVRFDRQYNPATRQEDNNDLGHPTRAIKTSVTQSEVDEQIRLTDTLFIILQHELCVTPKLQDFIDVCDERYEVIWFKQDPGKVLWRIYGRAS